MCGGKWSRNGGPGIRTYLIFQRNPLIFGCIYGSCHAGLGPYIRCWWCCCFCYPDNCCLLYIYALFSSLCDIASGRKLTKKNQIHSQIKGLIKCALAKHSWFQPECVFFSLIEDKSFWEEVFMLAVRCVWIHDSVSASMSRCVCNYRINHINENVWRHANNPYVFILCFFFLY